MRRDGARSLKWRRGSPKSRSTALAFLTMPPGNRPCFLESRTEEKNDVDCVDKHSRPQKQADCFTTSADESHVQHQKRAVCEHPVEDAGGTVRPATHAQSDHGDSDQATHDDTGTADFRADAELQNQRLFGAPMDVTVRPLPRCMPGMDSSAPR
jgi:hypothetical protein